MANTAAGRLRRGPDDPVSDERAGAIIPQSSLEDPAMIPQ
ncbi:hypothetical protein BZL29_0165 [Mycobacterium kansasii]|uniref:Uncharacterized protein n=1 Tax=Mycobacterium kansasii TaxID=1768 RepID=A0A1V3Y0K1_MYCKA|nr:hypothetical protein BZL29_0165 [Mycobacterium kansasii]